MKNLLCFAALVLGMASCQKDVDSLNVNVDGKQETVVTVTLPEVTRAASDLSGWENEQGPLNVIFQVYDEKGKTTSEMRQTGTIAYGQNTINFNVRLVPNRQYTYVAWADQGNYFDTTDLEKVTFKANTWNAMSEVRDAYTATKTIPAATSIPAVSLELTRPFAKVRVVTTDIKAITNLGLALKDGSVTYSTALPNSFNVVTGKVNDATEVKEHAINYQTDDYTDNANEKTLFTDYVLIPEDGVVNFSLTVNDNEKEITTVTFNTDIPVERNKLTTIKGNILTGNTDVNIKVEDEFKQPGIERPYVEVNSVAELQEAIENAEEGEETTIVLGENIDLGLGGIILSTRAEEPGFGIKVSKGKDIILDLGGKTLSMEKECTKHFSMIENNGNLTITGNGKISFKDTGAGDPNFGWGSYTVSNYGGNLVIENGTIEHLGEQNPGNGEPNRHMYCAVYQYSGSTTINGGKISTPTYRSARLWNGDMTINGGEFIGQVWFHCVGDGANLTINNGTFAPRGNDGSSVFVSNASKNVTFAVNGGTFNGKIGMDAPYACITGGTFTEEAKNGTNAALLANGYFFEKNGNNFVVKRTSEAKVGSIIDINGVKAVIFSTENGGKAVSVEQGGEMTWDESMDWANNLGEGWNLSTLSELQAIYAVRATLNKALAADNADNTLFWEGHKEEDGTYAAYWSSTLVEGSTGSTTKAYYMYFDNDGRVTSSFTMFPVEYSRAVYNLGYYNVGDIVEAAGQKGVVFSIENGVKAVSVAELNLNGKTWQNAIDWATELGEGWSLASMEDLNAIYDLRCELNDVLEADNAENALFWEGDVYYQKNGQNFYAAYLSCNEAPAGEVAPNGETYFANRVFIKIFNLRGYQVAPYSTFDCINKYAPLRDNNFARGVISL